MDPMLYLFALDPAPSDNAVKAGWTAFAVFIFLILATAFLLWSMTRQLRKAKKANEEGILPSQDDSASSDQSTSHTLHP
jgi:hypothetical protein